jgi:hypothetical protein
VLDTSVRTAVLPRFSPEGDAGIEYAAAATTGMRRRVGAAALLAFLVSVNVLGFFEIAQHVFPGR